MKYTAGRFTVGDDGSVSGPADYMEAHEGRITEVIVDSAAFRYGAANIDGPTLRLAAVALQTHYAGWAGSRDLLRMGASPAEEGEAAAREDNRQIDGGHVCEDNPVPYWECGVCGAFLQAG
tara:strand:- start:1122 stop:1484 length:363 start_codon:yes stop_codon:yes gene_type:complete